MRDALLALKKYVKSGECENALIRMTLSTTLYNVLQRDLL